MATFLIIFGLLLLANLAIFSCLSKNWYNPEAYCRKCGAQFHKVLMKCVGKAYLCPFCDKSQRVAEIIAGAISNGADLSSRVLKA